MLASIQKDPAISAQTLSKAVGISARKIEENIAKLKKRGILKRNVRENVKRPHFRL
ncbi:MAG: winged helix-turn-helix transcriptional regulator, partial [Nanoarchaeota archaeon]|nr:winged helix-turn-helix transcriptional regulator [Nanoarchaeota archaeon]